MSAPSVIRIDIARHESPMVLACPVCKTTLCEGQFLIMVTTSVGVQFLGTHKTCISCENSILVLQPFETDEEARSMIESIGRGAKTHGSVKLQLMKMDNRH